MKMVKILDTSLRDGEQTDGIDFSIDDKRKIALKLEELGLHYIEAGYPFSSDKEYDAVKGVAKSLSTSTVVALAGCKDNEIKAAAGAIMPAINEKRGRIHVFVGTSDIHKDKKLRKRDSDILEMIGRSVKLAKSYTENVQFSTEDGSRTGLDFLKKAVDVAIDAGATTINIPDTVGTAIPYTFMPRIHMVAEHPAIRDGLVALSIHNHHDLAGAVTNSLESVLRGVTQVEGTMLGIGERAGNMSIEAFIVGMDVQKRFFEQYMDEPFPELEGIIRSELYDTCKFIQKVTRREIAPNHPIIGSDVLKHVAGIHSDGVNKDKSTYEIFVPEEYGIPRHQSFLGPKAGYGAIKARFDKMGVDISDIPKDTIRERYNAIADSHGEVDDAGLMMVYRGDDKIPQRFKVITFNSSTSSDSPPHFIAKVYLDGEMEDIVKIGGTGQIDAMKKVITKHVGMPFVVEDYSRRPIDVDQLGSEGEAEASFVVTCDGERIVKGKAQDPDAFKADMHAYVEAVNRMMYAKK